MAKTLPMSSKEILAAQAEGGQAGVEAYKAAQRDIEDRKKQALAIAQAEAASRGAPAGAQLGVQAEVGGVYDQRLASMRQSQAAAEHSAASRVQRQADYNDNVLAARSLIGDQTAEAVAPINAQSDYQIRALERQGANDVERINAQLRLEMAKAEAAQLAAARRSSGGGSSGGGGGSSKAPKLADSDLEAMLGRRGTQKVQEAVALAQQALQQDKVRYTKDADAAEKQWARDRNRIGLNQMSARRDAVQSSPDLPPFYIAAPGQPSQPEPAVQEAISQIGSPLSALPSGPTVTPRRPTREPIPFRDVDPAQLGPEQFADLAASPDGAIYDALFTAAGPIQSSDAIARLLLGPGPGGDPYEQDIAARTMQQAMTLAAIQAVEAGEFDITEAELANALGWDNTYSPGMSVADVLGGQYGSYQAFDEAEANARQAEADIRSDEDRLYTDAQRVRTLQDWDRADRAREVTELETGIEIQDDAAASEFFAESGIPVPGGVPPLEALDAITSERFNEIAGPVQEVWLKGYSNDDLVTWAVREGVADPGSQPYDRIILTILEDLYG